MKKWYWSILLLCCVLIGCENRPLNDPSAHLVFSQDTLSFDTVFTHEGSAVRCVMVRNPHARALTIRSAQLEKGDAFRINMDGEQDLKRIQDVTIAGGDSLFLFVRATIKPDNRTSPLLMEDHLLLEVGDHTERLTLQAFGWDVHYIDSLIITGHTTFTADKPYLIRHYVGVAKGASLTIEAGARIYLHDGAYITSNGTLSANGEADRRILIQSDRLDNIYDGIPYIYCGGKWDGIYAYQPDSVAFQYTDILSGTIGAYVAGTGKEHVRIEHCRIHNHNLYGVVLQDVDALIGNTEISNCADYCAYVSGGRFDFVHTTLASYFNATSYAIQTTERNDKIAPLYIHNISKQRHTEVHFLNSILAGAQRQCLMLATPLPEHYNGEFAYSYLQTDTLSAHFAHDNAYPHFLANPKQVYRDTVFANTYYNDKAHYYDFTPDSLSRAIGIADSLIATRYPMDLHGQPRDCAHPDAGCYQYTK